VIERLRALRDRAIQAFSASISRQQRDPHSPPTPRDEQLEQEREELKRLYTELSEVQQGIVAMLEERSNPDAPYDTIEDFVEDLTLSDRTRG
jgi:hypothetical protein